MLYGEPDGDSELSGWVERASVFVPADCHLCASSASGTPDAALFCHGGGGGELAGLLCGTPMGRGWTFLVSDGYYVACPGCYGCLLAESYEQWGREAAS